MHHPNIVTLFDGLTVQAADTDITGLEKLFLRPEGGFRPVSAELLTGFSTAQLVVFTNQYAIYQLPTHELTNYLHRCIGGRSCLEIGAGNGVIGRALGIPTTDSYEQRDDQTVREAYQSVGVACISYGQDVEKLDAYHALRKYRPEVVLGCWVTDRNWQNSTWRMNALDELDIFLGNDHVQEYIFVGNDNVHRDKRLFSHPDIVCKRVNNIPWLYSRASRPELNKIYHFTRK